jgi:carbonic anhydrase
MCESCGLAGIAHQPVTSRRKFLAGMGTVAAGMALARSAFAAETGPLPKPQNAVTASGAREFLEQGNARYVQGVMRRHDFQTEREVLSGGQNPYAGILSCADSRIAPEYAFDSGRGDLFVCRVAGNYASPDIIASFEYAVAVLGVPLILVLGHDACGAIDATLKSLKDNSTLPGHLPSIVAALTPAVKQSAGEAGDPLANAIRKNVELNVAALKAASPILDAAVADKTLQVIGGVYRLETGKVEMV